MKKLYKTLISVGLFALTLAVGCSTLPADEDGCPEVLDRQSCEELPHCGPHPLGGIDPDSCEHNGTIIDFCIHRDISGGDDVPGFWTRWEDGEWKFYRAHQTYSFMRTQEGFISCLKTADRWPHGERPEACDTCNVE